MFQMFFSRLIPISCIFYRHFRYIFPAIRYYIFMVFFTPVRITQETKALLDDLKITPRETYDDVIKRLARMVLDDDPLSNDEIEDINQSFFDIKAGRIQTLNEVRDELLV